MKFKSLKITTILLFSMYGSFAQCLNGGCEVGLSREHIENGVFVGHYENGEKSGLGISYEYNPKGTSTSYANYIRGKKNGVEYLRETVTTDQTTAHTFKNYFEDAVIYPAFRFTKKGRKTKIEVAFDKEEVWKKYDGDVTKGNLEIKSIIHEGSPAFLAFNDKNQVMALSATVNVIELLSSEVSEKYYNPLQMSSKENRLIIDVFPKVGADETTFVTSADWDMQSPEEGSWLYKRYFNNELSYKSTYTDVLELPSQKDIKQQKLQKAFDFVAQQVEDYDFKNGYPGKAKDFIDMLKDIKERAEQKGLTISHTYDITMIKLYLQNGDRDKSLHYAQTAYMKSPNSYKIVQELITSEFKEHIDLLSSIKKMDGLASGSN